MPVCTAQRGQGVGGGAWLGRSWGGPRVTFSSTSGGDCAQSGTDREPAGRTDGKTAGQTDRQTGAD